MEISSTEENYLKAIYALQSSGDKPGVSTSSLSEHLNNKAASVTDMLKRLSDKKEQGINDPMMPIAWIRSYQIPEGQQGRAFTSTIGSSSDMLSQPLRRLWVNAVYWCLNLKVPARADAGALALTSIDASPVNVEPSA